MLPFCSLPTLLEESLMKKNVVFCLVFLDAIVWEAYALVYYFVERLHQAVGYEVICLQLDGFVWGMLVS
eukprot:XP_001705295.1 Hypothetical protein GL50803_2550 [Giardia lamblia ATCC 50803]